MPYHFAPRGSFAVIIPSSNAAVEAEYSQLLVPNVSLHYGRILIRNPDKLGNDADFNQFIVDLRKEIGAAITSVMQIAPDHMIMGTQIYTCIIFISRLANLPLGMSLETFWGGKEGAAEFEAWMAELNGGLDLATGAAACKAALEVFGAKKIGIVTPYQPVGDEQVRKYFGDEGFEVAALLGIRCSSAIAIARVQPEKLKASLREVNVEGVDALLQVGTNLFCGKIAAEMELELGKPVIAVNVATLWNAYRSNGIDDKITGWGSLFEKH
jgi:maleate isomerase